MTQNGSPDGSMFDDMLSFCGKLQLTTLYSSIQFHNVNNANQQITRMNAKRLSIAFCLQRFRSWSFIRNSRGDTCFAYPSRSSTHFSAFILLNGIPWEPVSIKTAYSTTNELQIHANQKQIQCTSTTNPYTSIANPQQIHCKPIQVHSKSKQIRCKSPTNP